MMIRTLVSSGFEALLLGHICLTATGPRDETLQVALEHSGGNRPELETALSKTKGEDTEYLITHASQYNLVNLTAEMIVENITYARKVHVALPYLGEKLDDEMWREWVLPHRVLDENLEVWRMDLYEQMQPVVAGKKTVREVVEAIHVWLVEGGGTGAARISFGNSENRCKMRRELRNLSAVI